MNDTARPIVSFGEFSVDALARELRRGDAPVHISPKAFDLLLYLLEQRPQALSKQKMLDRIWPNTFISEATLTSVIAEIREALGDQAHQPRFVRTVHRFGYAFCGSVTHRKLAPASIPASACFLRGGAGEFVLREGENVLGRDEGLSIIVDSATVSRRHARIVVTDGEAVVEDLGSKNGTFVQGERLNSPARIRDGDRLLIGEVALIFRVRRALDSTLTRQTGEPRPSPSDRDTEYPKRPRRPGAGRQRK